MALLLIRVATPAPTQKECRENELGVDKQTDVAIMPPPIGRSWKSVRAKGQANMLTILDKLHCVLHLMWLRIARRVLPNATRMVAVGSSRLELPLTHELPVYQKYFPFYDTVIVRLARAVVSAHPQTRGIDVGANVGDTLALMHQGTPLPVLCIEGDPKFFALLERNARLFPGTVVDQTFLGEKSAGINVAVATAGGTCELRAKSDSTYMLETLDAVLERHSEFADAKFLKIDTDGFDGAVIRGAQEFLNRASPVLFFEYVPDLLARNGDDGLSIFNFLRDLGYSRILVYSNFGELKFEVSTSDRRCLEILRTSLQGKGIREYFDLCVFPEREAPLFNTFVASELALFKTHPGKHGRSPR